MAAPDTEARDAILGAHPAELSRQLVVALNQLGDQPLIRKDSAHARPIYAAACEVARRISDPRAGFECRFHEATALLAETRYDDVLALIDELLAEATSSGNHADMARCFHAIGVVHRARGEHPEATSAFEQAMREAEAAGDREQQEQIALHIGSLDYFLGKYRHATSILEKALETARGIHQDRDTINLLIQLGGLWYTEKDYALALQYQKQAETLIAKTGIDDNRHTVYSNIALNDSSLGKIDLAVRYYKLALEDTPDTDLYGRMMVFYNYGAYLSQWGRNDEAIAKLREGLVLAERIERREIVPHFRITLAETALSSRHWAEAETFSRSALEAARGFAEPFLLVRANDALGVALYHLGRYSESEEALEASIEAIARLREELPAAPETLALFMRDKTSVYYHLMQPLLAEGRTTDALATAERAKSRVLVEVLAGGQEKTGEALTAAEKQNEADLWKPVTDLNGQIVDESRKSKPDPQRLQVLNAATDEARAKFRAFENGLYASHEQLRLRRLDIEPVAPMDLLDRLPARETALIEYTAGDDGIVMFVVTHSATRAYRLHVTPKQLAADVATFQRQLASRDVLYQTLAQSLYQSLIAPAAAQLAGSKALVIVPDGPLWKLPFQAIETPAGAFLLEQKAISYAPSLTVLNETLARRQRDGPADSRTLVVSGAQHPGQLPGIDAEVAGLVATYGAGRTKVLTRPEATADRIRQEASHYSVLHLASDAVFQDRNPMLSYLTLSQGSLNAREMMDLNLHSDLVVLSACETGRGEAVNGEGLLGMSWALFVAGTEATVASQWKVDSLSTADLMVAFHRALRAGAAKADALRSAELSVMRTTNYRHPFYWAAFQLIGAM